MLLRSAAADDNDANDDGAGENINVCWSPDGQTIAVGNKEDLVTFIDVKTHKPRAEEQFKFEVNEISWNNDADLFFLTSGQGSIHILRYHCTYYCNSVCLLMMSCLSCVTTSPRHICVLCITEGLFTALCLV